ncbi:MAG: response regulator transcription factor [Pseudomonadota bacterium]
MIEETTQQNIHILFVEDHHDLALSVCEYLALHNMSVDHASTAQLAKQLLTDHPYQVVILDINLPDGNGFEICQFMRTTLGLSTPVIMLTARDTLDDKLAGFESGSDDYLVKPFDMPELVARIQSLRNRALGLMGAQELIIGDLTLSVAQKTVHRQGQLIELSPLLYKLLHFLMRESPKPLSNQMMTQELWGEDTPDSDSLRSHLYMLRKVIDKPFTEKYIHTLKGQGVFIASELADSTQ